MIEAAGYLKLVLYISLIVCLFVPFGMAPLDGEPIVWMIGLAAYLVKITLAAIALGVWEVSIAKMRVFRVGEFLGSAFIFSFLAILLAFLSKEVLR